MKKLNILVTGIGGDIGYSIGKILKDADFVNNLVGTDIHKNHAGFLIFDNIEIINRADSNNYLNDLKKLIKQYNIDLIIPTSEFELRHFNQNNIFSIDGVKLLMSNKFSMDIGFDKLKTAKFLEDNNLYFPNTHVASKECELIIPSVYKSRTGSGSSSIIIVKDKDTFEYLQSKDDQEYIFQEFLTDDNNKEFTCGVYRFKDGRVKTVIISRLLNSAGVTVYGEVIENSVIEELIINLAELLDLYGSINVQLKLVNNKPYIFEINPRFSSTVLFRHKIGFTDLVWNIEETLDKIISSKEVKISKNAKYYRFYDEVII